MANKKKDTMQIRQMLLLHDKGYSNRKIARQLEVSRNTVNNYIKQFETSSHTKEELLNLESDELDKLFGQGSVPKVDDRYQGLKSYFPKILEASKLVGFTYQKIWEEYRAEHPGGYGYTQFLEHFHKWNSKTEATLKLNHKAGGSLFADYAGDKLDWVNSTTGELSSEEMFVSCLPASGLIFTEPSSSQKLPHFIQSVMNCLAYLGGCPQTIVVDNLKSAVTKASKYEGIANRTFRELALHYGAVLNPTRPYRPKDKAMVERVVDLVYEQIYFPIRDEVFPSRYHFSERIRTLLDALNDRPYKQLGCSRRELFTSIEKHKLMPLPPAPFVIKKYKRAKVQKTSHVYLSEDKHYYSVPYRYIGKHTMIHFSDHLVEVYHKHQRVATHHRDRTASGYSTTKEHLPSHHQKYLDWMPPNYLSSS